MAPTTSTSRASSQPFTKPAAACMPSRVDVSYVIRRSVRAHSSTARRIAAESPRLLHLGAHVAAREMIVHEPAGLHEGVRGRGSHEAEAAPLELLRERGGLGGGGRELLEVAWGAAPRRGRKGPDQLRERRPESRGGARV